MNSLKPVQSSLFCEIQQTCCSTHSLWVISSTPVASVTSSCQWLFSQLMCTAAFWTDIWVFSQHPKLNLSKVRLIYSFSPFLVSQCSSYNKFTKFQDKVYMPSFTCRPLYILYPPTKLSFPHVSFLFLPPLRCISSVKPSLTFPIISSYHPVLWPLVHLAAFLFK